MAVEPYEPPTRYAPVGEQDSTGQGFAGLGNSFAGPMGQLTTRFLQARISGMNRATTSNQANQRRVMNSPEFAMAKALGISTPYNSGGSQIDPTEMAQRAQAPGMDGDFARKKLAEFNQRNQGEGILDAAAGVAGLTKTPAAPRPAIQLPPESTSPTLTPPQPIAPYGTPSATPPASEPGPAAPAGAGKNEPAKPISRAEAEKATQAPIGEKPIAPYGQPEMQSPATPQRETTKGPRLDTYRGPNPAQATGNAGTFRGGQEARAAADANRAGAMSPQAQMQGANAYRKQQGMGEVDFAGQEPKYDQAGINETNARQGAAVQAMGNTRDAGKKMAFAEERNKAQDDREAIKKSFNEESELLASNRAANERMFGNPYGPDGGESFRQKEKAPELAPLGGYDKNVVPVGPMTNKPAGSQAEYDQRTKAFADAGEKQKQDNADAAMRKKQAGQQKNVDELNKKYAGPQPRYLGGGTIRRA